MLTQAKTTTEITAMRKSGQILAKVLDSLKKEVQPGVTTKALADMAALELKKLGGQPAFLGYQGFPDVLCVSVNDEVVHGIPRADKVIQDGNIVSLDFGVIYQNMITDGAISVIVGNAKPQVRHLLETTEKSLMSGIDAVRAGKKTGDIGSAVESVLGPKGYGIVRDLVGHGVGHHLHEEPNIPNYGVKNSGVMLSKHMTVAIEPMATLGTDQVYVADDGWTVKTRDGSWAAHFEHTILITQDGAEILTAL